MNTKPEIHTICEDNFATAIMSEKKPVLLLCMPRDDQFAKQMDIVTQTVAKYEAPIKIALLDESFIGSFKKKYRVPGTPTYLILKEGKEISRSLGLTDEQMLRTLITDACLAMHEASSITNKNFRT